MRRLIRTAFAGMLLPAIFLLLPNSPARAVEESLNSDSARSTTYYVDCLSAVQGSGSSQRPWNSLQQVNSATFRPGDRILFRRGTRCDGTLAPRGSGASGRPIAVDAYGKGKKPLIAGNGAPDAVYLYNQEYWELRNLEITNHGDGTAIRRGVYIVLENYGTGHHYRMINLTIHHVNGDIATRDNGGIMIWVKGSQVPSSYDDVVMDGNEIYSVDRSGIFMWSDWNCRAPLDCAALGWLPYHPWTKMAARNNTLHDVGGDGIVFIHTDHGIVENNVAYDINMRSDENNGGMWAFHGDYTKFQFNEVYRMRRFPGSNDGMAFNLDDGTNGVLYQYNYSHDNEGGFIMFCGCGEYGQSSNGVVRYNVSQNDGSRLVSAVGAQNGQVYNNTFYLPAGSTTRIVEELRASSYINFTNNIFYNAGTGGYDYPDTSASHYTWNHNIFYGNHPANEPIDPNKITADPRFVAPGQGTWGYRLLPNSPAKHAGEIIPDNGGRDFTGVGVPSKRRPSIGAFQ